jgi:phospholipase C
VTYDEHGGFFDHVSPPSAPAPGDAISDPDNNHHNFDFRQLGVRAPAIVVSPLIPRGVIDGTVYDHTSLLATLEQLFGLRPLTNRDASAATLTHLLSLAAPRTDAPISLPDAAKSDFHCDDAPSATRRHARSTHAARLGIHNESGAALPSIAAGAIDVTALANATAMPDFGSDALPLSVNQRGFLRIALLKALALARGRDRRHIAQVFLAIRTRGAARRFMHTVAAAARTLPVRKISPELLQRNSR